MDGWVGWHAMVIIGHRYSKSNFGANKGKYMILTGQEDWRRKIYGEGIYLVRVGEEEYRRKRRKMCWRRKSFWGWDLVI